MDNNDNISWVNKTIYQKLPSVPKQQPWLTPGRNCSVNLPFTISSIFFFFSFFFSSLCSLLPPHFPAVAFRRASMYHISLCFSCVALSGPGVRGWNKADPHFEADRVSKVWTWGQHLPSLPIQPQFQPDRGRVRQRCSLLQASGWVGGALQAGLFGVPLTPLALRDEKAFSFYQTTKTTSAQSN